MTSNKAMVGDLPLILSQSVPTSLVRYQREDFAADYGIGNTPWLSGASDRDSIMRSTTTYQKERIDQGASAGENSLSNWWLRSATGWHHGAGERYYDADTSDLYRFYQSNGVNPWELGELTLLPLTVKETSVAATQPTTVSGGTFYISNNLVWFRNSTTGAHTSVALPASAIPQKIVTDGTYALVGADLGIYQVSTALTVTKYYSIPSGSATWTVQAMGYVKDRLVVGCTITDALPSRVFELARTPAAIPTVVSKTADSRYEYATTDLTYVSVCELNSAIAVGYTIGAISKVVSFGIDPASPLAAILDPTVIAELPRGETLNQIRSYLNTYVVLATSAGLRVGTQGTDGASFTYGPLNITGNCNDISFNSSYLYVTRTDLLDSIAGLWRVNLGTEVGNVYAYAADLATDVNVPNGSAFAGATSQKIITSSSGVWVESLTLKVETGWIKSGWIRWGTSESKIPVSLSLRTTTASSSSVGLSVYNDSTYGDSDYYSYDVDTVPLGMRTEVILTGALGPSDHYEVMLTINRDTGGSNTTAGPIVQSWTLRGLPAPRRSRTFTIPLMCYESESDSNGNTVVADPWLRISYLERMEQYGGAVLFQDFSNGEERICVIRAVQFEQRTAPPFARGFGGVVTLQLQTIDYEEPIV